MENNSSPNITSFVIRFVQDGDRLAQGSAPYRGAIRHVQTDEEISFTRWQDAVNFIRRFVPLDGEGITPPGP